MSQSEPAKSAYQEVVRSMSDYVETQLSLLNPVDKSWQPSDVIPDLSTDKWEDTVRELRSNANAISDEVIVVLVGDTITEEALPSYQTMINRHEGLMDATGANDNPWAKWTRGWTAEENRHGELLNRYLYLCGRVNMRSVEITTQHLIRNGFDTKTANHPYKGLIYTSFQERATRISHGNVALLAIEAGDELLGKICNLVAGDEARHEEAYKRFVKKFLELDPSNTLIAFAEMMKARIAMPARLMSDGIEKDLFGRFSIVAQKIGVYTARDYAEIIEHLIKYWDIPSISGLSPEAVKAQEYVCGLGVHYHRFADRLEARTKQPVAAPLSWIFNRSV